ncbi:unnamed protein product, partial [Didymodactylos carnosus]
EDNPNNDEESSDDGPHFPVSHEIDLKQGTKSVSCLTLDPGGLRMITGDFNYEMKMWDFSAMDKNLRSFRTLQPCEAHQLKTIEYSPVGDMILVISGNCQAKVLDREGIKNY